MNRATPYTAQNRTDHIDRLYTIAGLSDLGLAATDSALDIVNMQDALGSIFETIYELASEAVELAEQSEKASKKGAIAQVIPEAAP